jgi:hypothetical protein
MNDFLDRARGLATRLGKVEQQLGRIADDLALLIADATKGEPQSWGWDATVRSWRPLPKKPQELLAKRLAERGVEEVRLTRTANGGAHVRIDGVEEFDLPPRLADLLEILCVDTGSGDGLVAFKKWPAIARLLGKKPNAKGKHAVLNLVSRLKTVLRNRGANPYWIQETKSCDLRFAVRRQKKTVIQ